MQGIVIGLDAIIRIEELRHTLAMDSCALMQYKPRKSFVKPHLEAPRQVIGFNLLPKEETTKANYEGLDDNLLPSSETIKRAEESNYLLFNGKTSSNSHKGATSPRSALQQLLLNPLTQSQPATSSPSANHTVTHALPTPACQVQPPASSHSPNHNLTGKLPPASSASSSPTANHRSITGIFIKSVGQSQCASSPSPSAREMKSGQSTWASSASSSSANQSWTIRQESVKERMNTAIDYEARGSPTSLIQNEIKGRLTGVIKEESKKSSWKEVGNPEKSKKSSLFMFVVSSSPAADQCHQLHHHYHNHLYAEKDMDFLNSCHLCRRFLGQGQDVFMYSGDKAFCSMECRYQQIVIDERNERRAPSVIRSGASQIMMYQHTTTTTTATVTVPTSATHHPIMINKPKYFINNTAAAA